MERPGGRAANNTESATVEVKGTTVKSSRNICLFLIYAKHTGLTPVDVIRVLLELQAAIIYFLLSGRGVKLEGLGTYLPNINYQGVFDVAHRLDRRLKRALNIKGEFSGRIRNKKNIGKTADEIYALWNREHPEELLHH